ncbi:MAG: NAD-dependent epimerase/dehydratase family protein [Methylococcaceae bacterium]
MAKILIIGCGAIGTGLAVMLSAKGHEVTGVKRSPPPVCDTPVNYCSADITSAKDLEKLPGDFDVLFFIVSADGRTEQSYRDVYETGLNNVLARFSGLPWIFVSSTSVYGQTQGEWVDENSIAQPDKVTSRLIRQAELRLIEVNPQNIIVRFSGIYGPGREYLIRMAQQAPAIQNEPPYFTNRIHQRDCVAVLAFLLEQRLSGIALEQCYLASDDDPAPVWEVMSWLAGQMHCQAPTVKVAGNDAEMNKRCNNQRLKALGYQFHYPSYKDGYLELIQQ